MAEEKFYSFNSNEPYNPKQQWKIKLNQLKSQYGIINADHTNNQQGYYKDNETGIFSPVSGSHIKIHDNGTIDIFASESLGIRLDPNTEAVSIIAKKLNINTQNFDIETNPIYFRFNSQPLDIDQLNVKPPKRGEIYSPEFKAILKELKINE